MKAAGLKSDAGLTKQTLSWSMKAEAVLSTVIFLGLLLSCFGYTVEHDKYLLVDCLNQ